MRLPVGTPVTTAAGPVLTFHGTQFDHYDHGSDVLWSLSGQTATGSQVTPDTPNTWLASALGPQHFHLFAGVCVRLGKETRDVLEVEVAKPSAPTPPKPLPRCHHSCCPPHLQRAPDGTEECCFCNEDP